MPASRPLTTMAYAAGLASVLALSACTSGGDTPPSTPTSTAGARTSVPATSNAPATTSVDPVLDRIPAAARPETKKGAEAFAKFYFEQLNASFKAGDPTLTRGLFEKSCDICVSLNKSTQQLREQNRRHGGDTLEVTVAEATAFDKRNRQVLVRIKQNSVPVLDENGQVVKTTKAGQGDFVAILQYNEHWVVEVLARP